jgi:hypothetical protein
MNATLLPAAATLPALEPGCEVVVRRHPAFADTARWIGLPRRLLVRERYRGRLLRYEEDPRRGLLALVRDERTGSAHWAPAAELRRARPRRLKVKRRESKGEGEPALFRKGACHRG